jgi:hypothetical protein
MNYSSNDAPQSGFDRHMHARRQCELACRFVPPGYDIAAVRIKRTINHCDIAVKNAGVLPLIAGNPKQKCASRSSHQQLMQI